LDVPGHFCAGRPSTTRAQPRSIYRQEARMQPEVFGDYPE